MAQGKPTLHHMNDSNSQKCLWCLEELGIPYNLRIHTRQESGKDQGRAPPELKQSHPLGKAPQLVTAQGRVIVESSAILKYLIETYDTSKKFQGDSGKNDVYRDAELSAIADASINPIMLFKIFLGVAAANAPFFVRGFINGIQGAIDKFFAAEELDKLYGYLNDQLGDQEYFMGSSPGHADFIISWPTDSCVANKFLDLKKYPKLDAWNHRIHQRAAWKRALEKGNGYNLDFMKRI